MKQPWYVSVEDLAQMLNTHPTEGLSSAEAKARLGQYGPNPLREAPGRSPLSIPFLNSIPAMAILLLCLGQFVEDGVMVLLGHGIGLGAWGYSMPSEM